MGIPRSQATQSAHARQWFLHARRSPGNDEPHNSALRSHTETAKVTDWHSGLSELRRGAAPDLFRGDAPIRNLRPLFKYLVRHKWILIVGIACLALENLFALLIPWILKLTIDQLRQAVTSGALLHYAMLIVGATAAQGFFKFLMRRLMIGTSRTIEYEMANDLFIHLQSLSPAYFNRVSTGDITARATNDINNVRMFLGPGIMNLFNTVIVFFAALGLMLKLNARLTFFALAALPLLSILVYAGCYLGFALAPSAWMMWPLFAVYGLFEALGEPSERALVGDIVPSALRGRGFGVYHAVRGFAALLASFLFGLLWDATSAGVAFAVGAGIAFASGILLWTLVPGRKPNA